MYLLTLPYLLPTYVLSPNQQLPIHRSHSMPSHTIPDLHIHIPPSASTAWARCSQTTNSTPKDQRPTSNGFFPPVCCHACHNLLPVLAMMRARAVIPVLRFQVLLATGMPLYFPVFTAAACCLMCSLCRRTCCCSVCDGSVVAVCLRILFAMQVVLVILTMLPRRYKWHSRGELGYESIAERASGSFLREKMVIGLDGTDGKRLITVEMNQCNAIECNLNARKYPGKSNASKWKEIQKNGIICGKMQCTAMYMQRMQEGMQNMQFNAMYCKECNVWRCNAM